jgi:hypothetical protein
MISRTDFSGGQVANNAAGEKNIQDDFSYCNDGDFVQCKLLRGTK